MNWDVQSKLKELIKQLPSKPGIYMMRDRLGKVLYVGKAKDLKKRVRQYFQVGPRVRVQKKIQHMVPLIYDIDMIEVKSEVEALVLESKYIKEFKPKYNTLLTDDKAFYRIRVNLQKKFPCFQLVRNKPDAKSLYFGPYINSRGIQKVLKELRKKWGVLLDPMDPKRIPGTDKYRLYEDVRAEIYGHRNEVTLEEYQSRVDAACRFLQKEISLWMQEVRDKMQTASQKQLYEEASRLRDIYIALKEAHSKARTFDKDPKKTYHQQALMELKDLLHLSTLPRHFECFDISHISGAFLVASMIVFKEGKPSRKEYKHYNIKGFSGNDDYKAMEEVVGRRYLRLHKNRAAYPDFVLIDGGLGQVRAALEAFSNLDLPRIPIIGLAKKREIIVFANERAPVELPRSAPSLQLLQQARDEAHRFANTFNAKKRGLKIKESILDECPGLGPSRKALLLKHFKDIRGLKQASIDDLKAVGGIGPYLAKRIKQFLFDNL